MSNVSAADTSAGRYDGAVRQVRVHVTDEVGVAREHAPEPVDVGAAEAPAPAAVQDVHSLRMLAGEGVGHLAGAVGRVVVDDEHAVVALPEHVRDQHREVVALVVGRDHDGDVHAPCDSSWKARQVVERWFLRVMLGVSVVAWSLLLLAELGWFRLGLVAFLVAVTMIGFGLWGVFRTVPPAPATAGGGLQPALAAAAGIPLRFFQVTGTIGRDRLDVDVGTPAGAPAP